MPISMAYPIRTPSIVFASASLAGSRFFSVTAYCGSQVGAGSLPPVKPMSVIGSAAQKTGSRPGVTITRPVAVTWSPSRTSRSSYGALLP